MVSGSCCCGKVSYQYHGEIDEVSMCHCTLCQKAQGGPMVAVCPISADQLEIQGAGFLSRYESSEGKFRVFCRHCGSPIYSENKQLPGIKRLRLGTLDQPINPRKRYHKFVDSKATWFEIGDDLPQFPGQIPKSGT